MRPPSLTAIFGALLLCSSSLSAQSNWIPHEVATLEAPIGFKGLVAADMDSDGDLDFVISGGGGYLYWLETLPGAPPIRHGLGRNGLFHLRVADVDSDGFLDIIGMRITEQFQHRQLMLGRSLGNGRFAWELMFGFAWEEHVVIGDSFQDLDGDGDLDLAGTKHRITYWLENDGNGFFTYHEITAKTLHHWATRLFCVDMDGDHDIDLFTHDTDDYRYFWWENDGTANFTPHNIEGGLPHKRYFVSLADRDAIGALRFFTHDSDALNDRLRISGFRKPNRIYQIPEGYWEAPPQDTWFNGFCRDFDQDGDVDLAFTAHNGGLVYYDNIGSDNWAHSYSFEGPNDLIAPVDYDLDGDLDLVAGVGNVLRWWENQPQQATFRLIADQPNGPGSMRLSLHHGPRGQRTFTAMSTDPRNESLPGLGNFHGLFIDPADLGFQWRLNTINHNWLDTNGDACQKWGYLPFGISNGLTLYLVAVVVTAEPGFHQATDVISFTPE